jgi:transcriptional regulator with XRE-family HTH domain
MNDKKTPEERANDTRKAIIRRRKMAGISQQRLADILGVSRSLYGRFEVGQRDLTITELCTIANALEIDVVALLQPEDI